MSDTHTPQPSSSSESQTSDASGRPYIGLEDTRFDERGLPHGRAIDGAWEIGPRDVHRRIFRVGEPGKTIREGDTVPLLIDCRTAQEAEIASISGAMLVPVHEVNARLPELREHEARPVIVYCHHGRRSLQVAATLREVGFEDVRSMHGGIDLWSQSVDPKTPRY